MERLEGTNKGFFLVAILIDMRCCPRSVSAFKTLFYNHFLSLFFLEGLCSKELAVREMGKHVAKKAEKRGGKKTRCTKRKTSEKWGDENREYQE